MSTDIPPVLESVEHKTSCQAVLGAPLMCDDSSEKGDETLEVVNTTDTPGTLTKVTRSGNQDTYDMEASPTTTEENSPKQITDVMKKNGIRSFFKNTWKAIKLFPRRNKVGPCSNPADPNLKAKDESHLANPGPFSGPSNLMAEDESHLANPGPFSGPSNLKAEDESHLANPGPFNGPSNLKAEDESHLANPGPFSGPSKLKAEDESHQANPGPFSSPSNLRAADESNVANPEPLSGPSNLKTAGEPQSDDSEPVICLYPFKDRYPKHLKLPGTEENREKGIFACFRRKWKAFKSIFTGKNSLSALYEAGQMFAGGASGVVYEGTRKTDGQKVAIKCVRRIPLDDKYMEPEVYVNLLLMESPLCPNIVQMYDWAQDADRYLMVMEYPYPCVTLDRFIRRSGGLLSETVAQGIMRQLIEAINYCLNRGIVHYDLHFGNVLVNTNTLQVKVIDFGNARVLTETSGDPRSRFMFETPPEFRFDNFDNASWTTVYCLGRALHIMVNGVFGPLRTNLSKEVVHLIKKCTQLPKANRPNFEEILEHDWFTKEELTYDQNH